LKTFAASRGLSLSASVKLDAVRSASIAGFQAGAEAGGVTLNLQDEQGKTWCLADLPAETFERIKVAAAAVGIDLPAFIMQAVLEKFGRDASEAAPDRDAINEELMEAANAEIEKTGSPHAGVLLILENLPPDVEQARAQLEECVKLMEKVDDADSLKTNVKVILAMLVQYEDEVRIVLAQGESKEYWARAQEAADACRSTTGASGGSGSSLALVGPDGMELCHLPLSSRVFARLMRNAIRSRQTVPEYLETVVAEETESLPYVEKEAAAASASGGEKS
jgi:hypothetical protein